MLNENILTLIGLNEGASNIISSSSEELLPNIQYIGLETHCLFY